MTGYYFLFSIFVVVWIIGVYLFFNREKKVLQPVHAPASDIIATTDKVAKIRIIFDYSEKNNLDIKSLADFTVKYADLLSGNYSLPSSVGNDKEELTGESEGSDLPKQGSAFDWDLSDYINIFTLKSETE